MTRRFLLPVLLLLGLSCGSGREDRLSGAVERYLDALGGRRTLEEVASVHTVDSLWVAGLAGISEAWWIREPFMGRVRVTLGPVEQETLFLGDSVWSLDRNGHGIPAGREGRMQLEFARATVFHDAFLRPEDLDYLGDTLIHGERADRIRLGLPDPVVYCLSRDTGLPLAVITTSMGMRVVQYPGDFSRIEGGLIVAGSTRDVLEGLGMESASRNLLTEINTLHRFQDDLFSLIAGPPDWELEVSGVSHPFQLHLGHIYLEVNVNGRSALAILDSGAGATITDSAFAAEMGLLPEGSFSALGIGGSRGFAFARVDSVHVAGAVLRNQVSAVMPIRDAFLPHTGRRIDMILGYDFLSRFITEIHYPRGTLTLHRPGGYPPPEEGVWVQADLFMGLMAFEALLEDSIPMDLLLDTGAGGGLHLTRTFLERRGTALGNRPSYTSTVEGVGGTDAVEVIQVRFLTVGGIRIPCGDTPVFPGEGPLSRFDGLAGSDILSRFVVVLDYSGPGFFLIPGEAPLTP